MMQPIRGGFIFMDKLTSYIEFTHLSVEAYTAHKSADEVIQQMKNCCVSSQIWIAPASSFSSYDKNQDRINES